MGRSDIMYKCPLYLRAICKWDEPSEKIQRRASMFSFNFSNNAKALCKLVILRTGLGLAYTVMAGVSTPFACKRCQGGLHHNENTCARAALGSSWEKLAASHTWWKMSMATDLRGQWIKCDQLHIRSLGSVFRTKEWDSMSHASYYCY